MNKSEWNNMKSYIQKIEHGNLDTFMYKSIEELHCLINNKFFVCYNDKSIKYWSLKKGPKESNPTIAKF